MSVNPENKRHGFEQRHKKTFKSAQRRHARRDRHRQIVSDHAVVRYLELVLGINTVKIREDILGDKRQFVEAIKSGKIENDGLILIVNNSVVVTVLLADPGKGAL
jgi:hypothetical protein